MTSVTTGNAGSFLICTSRSKSRMPADVHRRCTLHQPQIFESFERSRPAWLDGERKKNSSGVPATEESSKRNDTKPSLVSSRTPSSAVNYHQTTLSRSRATEITRRQASWSTAGKTSTPHTSRTENRFARQSRRSSTYAVNTADMPEYHWKQHRGSSGRASTKSARSSGRSRAWWRHAGRRPETILGEFIFGLDFCLKLQSER